MTCSGEQWFLRLLAVVVVRRHNRLQCNVVPRLDCAAIELNNSQCRVQRKINDLGRGNESTINQSESHDRSSYLSHCRISLHERTCVIFHESEQIGVASTRQSRTIRSSADRSIFSPRTCRTVLRVFARPGSCVARALDFAVVEPTPTRDQTSDVYRARQREND